MIFNTSYWAVPSTNLDVIVKDATVTDEVNGTIVGRALNAERRIEWQPSPDDVLEARISAEKDKYEEWAQEVEKISKVLQPKNVETRSDPWWKYPIYERPAAARTIRDCPDLQHLAGKSILDIGGSARDSWRFVWHGDARSVDQAEISEGSQQLAYRKLNRLFANQPELVERFTFHTTPAESLPFKDSSFDVVFSRATIHHTQRPRVFQEISRVLKTGGIFWMIEPRLPALVYRAMHLGRMIRRADRGTDDPLRNREVAELNQIIPVEVLHAEHILVPYMRFFSNRLLNTNLGRILTRLDNRLVSSSLGERLGHNISLVARQVR